MRRPLAFAACFSILLANAGCQRLSSGAREDFAQRYSCPDDRVEARLREDLRATDVLGIAADASAPSAEVMKDPARLAKWQQDQARRRESRSSAYVDYDVFEVTGCGHTDLLACHHPTGRNGGSRTDTVSCQQGRKP